MRRLPEALLCALLVANGGWASATSAGQVVLDGLVATIGARVIMLSDVRLARGLGFIPSSMSDDAAAARLIDRTLMITEVERFQAPDPPGTRVEEAVAALRTRVGAQAWMRTLAENGVDEAYVRVLVTDDLRLETYLRQRFGTLAEPSDDELRQAYDERQASLPEEARVSFEVAREVLRKSLHDARFDQLVREWVEELRARADVSLRERVRPGAQ